MIAPEHPIAAATHPDPYPYYAELVAQKPLYYDQALGLWVASSAEAVTAVLSSDICRVRPVAEPVPNALLGSAAADVFRSLVRMNDGAAHTSLKPVVSATLASVNMAQATEQSQRWARMLANAIDLHNINNGVSEYMFRLPVYVVGSLLGISQEQLNQTALLMRDFVYCLSPLSSVEQIERGKAAAGALLTMFHSLLVQQSNATDRLLGALGREAGRAGHDDVHSIVANGIGFISQAYEATAGLISNTLLALAAHLEAYEQVAADTGLMRQMLLEVLRYDSPIQNTRRFLAQDGIVAGQEMRTGAAILVVLAAANRDPAVNSDPTRFDLFRRDRRIFTFGLGAHACPGETLAVVIAQAGVEQLLASGIVPQQLAETVTYRVSVNARIPVLCE
ncbi:MAG: cytochrome P450 [Blastochloris sp.]|nr:cytochrome P450 [Blastochloris sp.]